MIFCLDHIHGSCTEATALMPSVRPAAAVLTTLATLSDPVCNLHAAHFAARDAARRGPVLC